MLGAANLRKGYLPGPHVVAAHDPKARPQMFNLLRPCAPNSMERDEFLTSAHDVPALEDAFRGALGNAARQGTAGRLRAEIGVPNSVNAASRNPALEKMFEVTPRATGEARTRTEKAADVLRGVGELPKTAITAFGLKHGLVNVPTLALVSEGPGAAIEALVRGAQLARKSGAARYEALRPGIEGGVITPCPDRANAIADSLARLPAGIGATVGAASKGANALTWAIDDAVKQAVLKGKLARGMSPNRATAQTLREMIDYGHRSPAVKAVSNFPIVAPFVTFRSRLPGAIASSVSRHPERALALDRAAQGFFANGRVDVNGPDGKRHTPTVSNPFSDVLPLGEEPQKYARAMVGDPVRAILSGVGLPTEQLNAKTARRTRQCSRTTSCMASRLCRTTTSATDDGKRDSRHLRRRITYLSGLVMRSSKRPEGTSFRLRTGCQRCSVGFLACMFAK